MSRLGSWGRLWSCRLRINPELFVRVGIIQVSDSHEERSDWKDKMGHFVCPHSGQWSQNGYLNKQDSTFWLFIEHEPRCTHNFLATCSREPHSVIILWLLKTTTQLRSHLWLLKTTNQLGRYFTSAISTISSTKYQILPLQNFFVKWYQPSTSFSS